MSSEWESVIGLEIHVQLRTKSKIFSGASTAFGAEPNTQASAVDMALPGVLPVMNESAAHMAVKFGLAIGAQINQRSVFARKNYFYPDLPKGYQISQYEIPIVGEGRMQIPDGDGDEQKTIRITRAHLEEDAGKSLHEGFDDVSGIDLNRAGTPLIEVVTEPDMRNATQAVVFLRKLHALVRYLDICDGNMQEGSFRCDANVSVRQQGDTELGTRAEVKNINSFRFVEKAINYEIARQIEVIEDGGKVVQETRLYDPNADETRSMRSKEEAHDYRYFPDPDLPPMVLTDEVVKTIQESLPELPDARCARFIEEYTIDSSDAQALTANRDTANFFEKVVEHTQADAKTSANWITGELASFLNKNNLEIDDSPVSAENLAGLLDRLHDNTISGKIAKNVFDAMWNGEGTADEVIDAQGLKQITDSSEIESLIDSVLNDNADQVEQYRSGNEKVFGFFVGQVMKSSGGKANPKQVNEILKKKLKG